LEPSFYLERLYVDTCLSFPLCPC